MKETKYKPYIAGIISSIILGFTFIFIKMGLTNLTPVVSLSYRFVTAAVVFRILKKMGIIKIDLYGKNIRELVIIGVLYPVITMLCETTAMQYVSTIQAGTIIALIPVCVAIMGVFFLKEMPTHIQKVFIISSVLGVVIVVLSGKSNGSNVNFGIWLLIGTVIANGFFTILSRRNSIHFTGMEISYVMAIVGAIVFTAIAVVKGILEHNLFEIYIEPLKYQSTYISVFYLGAIASTFAMSLTNYLFGKLPAYTGSVFTNLSTIITILVGVLIANENFKLIQIVGSILIILGVWGTNYMEYKKIGKKIDLLKE